MVPVCGALLLVAACSSPVSIPSEPAAPSIPPGFTFVSGAALIVSPADDPSRPCGLAREYKIGGRVGPAAQQSDGTWRLSGCFYSHGNEMWNAEVVLVFPPDTDPDPGPDVVVVPARNYVGEDHREVSFGVTVRRKSVEGMRAYLATYVR
jgi:hypothetical protein